MNDADVPDDVLLKSDSPIGEYVSIPAKAGPYPTYIVPENWRFVAYPESLVPLIEAVARLDDVQCEVLKDWLERMGWMEPSNT